MVDESAEGGKWVRACVHAPVFIIDGGEVSKWLRNKIEMKVGAGVVILEQENELKGSCACFLFALHWVPVVQVMDKHLSRQVVLPERHCPAEEGNREQRCHDALGVSR